MSLVMRRVCPGESMERAWELSRDVVNIEATERNMCNIKL